MSRRAAALPDMPIPTAGADEERAGCCTRFANVMPSEFDSIFGCSLRYIEGSMLGRVRNE